MRRPHHPVNQSPATHGLSSSVHSSSSSQRPLFSSLWAKWLGKHPCYFFLLYDSSNPQNSLLRTSEFDQDHNMIMFSLQVDCELNVSSWLQRSIAFPLFFLFFFFKPSFLQQRPLADILSITPHRVLPWHMLNLSSG